MTDTYTPEELMAVVISREVRNGETVATGLASAVPAAGCILAEQTHAPDATLIILGSRQYYPFPAGSSELHFMAQRGELDLFFLSPLQIDCGGSINLHLAGSYDEPALRLPGAYGSVLLYRVARRVILFRTEHTRRTFVGKVDFVTAAGVPPENATREGGPSVVVTPRALFAWDADGKRWILAAVQPGSTVTDIEANTGFPLVVPQPVSATPPPTRQELRVLRTRVREKLRSIYPGFADKCILPP